MYTHIYTHTCSNTNKHLEGLCRACYVYTHIHIHAATLTSILRDYAECAMYTHIYTHTYSNTNKHLERLCRACYVYTYIHIHAAILTSILRHHDTHTAPFCTLIFAVMHSINEKHAEKLIHTFSTYACIHRCIRVKACVRGSWITHT